MPPLNSPYQMIDTNCKRKFRGLVKRATALDIVQSDSLYDLKIGTFRLRAWICVYQNHATRVFVRSLFSESLLILSVQNPDL